MNFYEHLKSYLSDEQIDKLKASLSEENKHGVLLNTKKMSDEMFLSLFPHVEKHPIVKHAYIFDKREYELGKSIYHALGCFYIQEPSAMVPAYLLNVQEGDIVLDLCAAPGGKTIQASLLMNDSGLIIANDLSKSRAFSIIENEERLGLGNIIVTNNDFSKIYKNYLSTFDKIILDAPCSGSGMFRKEDKMMQDWSYNKVLKFADIQKELILYAYEMLKPGGAMCYSTCSFSLEEDEDVIEYLLKKTDAEIIENDHKLFFRKDHNPLGFHLLPSLFPGEGHYICLIRKPGVLIKAPNSKTNKTGKYGFQFEYKFGNYLFGNNVSFNTKYLNIVRLGVKIGEIFNNDVKYDYHYAHYIQEFSKKYELNDAQVKTYFTGNVLNVPIDKGTYLLTYKGINVDITKSDGRMIKNSLPKGLRTK